MCGGALHAGLLTETSTALGPMQFESQGISKASAAIVRFHQRMQNNNGVIIHVVGYGCSSSGAWLGKYRGTAGTGRGTAGVGRVTANLEEIRICFLLNSAAYSDLPRRITMYYKV